MPTVAEDFDSWDDDDDDDDDDNDDLRPSSDVSSQNSHKGSYPYNKIKLNIIK